MRTNIDIDADLLKQAMKATGTTTKKAAVEASLRKVLELDARKGILKWRGKIQWEGDLNTMRESRFPQWHGTSPEPVTEDQDTAPPNTVVVP